MKKIFTLLSIVLLVFLPSWDLRSDCGDDTFYDNCSASLQDFTFLKSFVLDEELLKKRGYRPVIKFSNIFTKGGLYLFSICDEIHESNGRMILRLYNSNNKLITSTHDPVRNKYYTKFKFPCKSTEVYYLEFSFPGNYKGCGLGIIGMKI